jgi:hypothetical protein
VNNRFKEKDAVIKASLGVKIGLKNIRTLDFPILKRLDLERCRMLDNSVLFFKTVSQVEVMGR